MCPFANLFVNPTWTRWSAADGLTASGSPAQPSGAFSPRWHPCQTIGEHRSQIETFRSLPHDHGGPARLPLLAEDLILLLATQLLRVP
jgi:hypothetical protein